MVVPKKLAEYAKKRDPARTNEPFGAEPVATTPTKRGAYVVHLHDATRRHYDLRVEIGGVLASFAVPRGPSLDPDAKHLAVHTEDHPIEYLEFEDVIPDGQYGAGPMIAWDRGRVEYVEAPAEEGMARGKLDLHLTGYKLRGRFALVKIKKSESGNEWLLFKKKDAWSSKEIDVVAQQPRSVLSGLAIDELASRAEIAGALAAAAREAGGRTAGPAWRAELAPLRVGRAPLEDARWTYEAKFEGARVLAEKRGDDVLLTHAGRDVTAFYPEIARAVRALAPERLALDGDVVVLVDGRPSLAKLLERIAKTREGERPETAMLDAPATLVVGDLLALGDRELSLAEVEARKRLLRALVRAPGILRVADHVVGNGQALLAFARAHGLEGIVARGGDRAVLVRAEGAAVRPPEIDHSGAAALVDPHTRAPARFVPTNRGKVFWPEDGLTKGDLCDYYEAIAPTILPYLRDRPMALVRYPDGIHGKSFFQWKVPLAMPAWVKTLALRPDEDAEGERTVERRGFLVNDVPSLLYIANLGCIPIHVLACRAPSMESCDFLTIDFDPPKEEPAKSAAWTKIVALARTLREVLAKSGLAGFPKTSGQAGLHVLVPLGGGTTFDTAVVLAQILGSILVKRHPGIATMERVVSKRGDRVYVDTGQTGRSRTIVAPWSVRAQPGAPVSTPLAWDEVDDALDRRAFTVKTIHQRIASAGDPMAPLLATTADVRAAAERLRALF